jgi:hypothetical protein
LVRVESWKCIPTWVSLIPNPNHETKKPRIRTQHVQNKNQTRFYYKNETKIEQGCDKKTFPKLILNRLK